MKIAVFGWYGHDNAGDERIKFCLQDFVLQQGGIESIEFYDLHNHAIKGKTNKFDHYDLVMIGGGGLVFSQCNYHDFINNIKTKVVTLGISIERPTLSANAKKFTLALLNKSVLILVRDEESAKKLLPYDQDKKVRVSADLTFLKPYETVNCVSKNIVGVNLLPKPVDFKYSTLSNLSFSFFARQLGRFGINDFIRIIDFKDLIQDLKNKFDLLPIPLYCASQNGKVSMYQKSDIDFLRLYFNEVPQEFSETLIDKCAIFLSMRLHGAIFSVQKGIPVISLSYLPKNRNFMKEVGLENFVIDSIKTSDVVGLIEKMLNEQEFIREKMRTYKEIATARIQQDVIQILNMIG